MVGMRTLVTFAVWAATSLARFVVWSARTLVAFTVWAATSLARFVVWSARSSGGLHGVGGAESGNIRHLVCAEPSSLCLVVGAESGGIRRLVCAEPSSLCLVVGAEPGNICHMVGAESGDLVLWIARTLAMFMAWAVGMGVRWLIALGPIGLLIVGIGLLGGAAFLLMLNWESIDARWRTLWDGLKAKAVGALNSIIDKINDLISLWNRIPVVPDVPMVPNVDPGSIGTPSLEGALNFIGGSLPGGGFRLGTLLKKGANALGNISMPNIPGFAEAGS